MYPPDNHHQIPNVQQMFYRHLPSQAYQNSDGNGHSNETINANPVSLPAQASIGLAQKSAGKADTLSICDPWQSTWRGEMHVCVSINHKPWNSPFGKNQLAKIPENFGVCLHETMQACHLVKCLSKLLHTVK